MGLAVSFFKDLKPIQPSKNFRKMIGCECSLINLKDTKSTKLLKCWAHDEFNEHNDREGWHEAKFVGRLDTDYIGYGMFRRALCMKLFQKPIQYIWNKPDKYKDKPFYYLLNFADNEGTISGRAFQKLKEDFRSRDFIFEEQWMTALYAGWKEYMLNSDALQLH